MIDKELIHRKINLIAKDLKELRPITNLSEKVYLRDPVHELIAERLLERTITRMIDINYHLIVESGEPPPKDYYSSFIELYRLKILSYDFANDLARYAGLRNRLVHEYNELDKRKVWRASGRIIEDLPKYLKHIEGFVENKKVKKLL